MGLFWFMRAGEFTVKCSQDFDIDPSLSVLDVAVDSHTNLYMVRVYLKQSKTNLFRHGVDIFLGCMDAVLCPVAVILHNAVLKLAVGHRTFSAQYVNLSAHSTYGLT